MLNSTQPDFPLQQGFCHSCSHLQPHGASLPHTEGSLCLELLPAAIGQAQKVALLEALVCSAKHAEVCSSSGMHLTHLPAMEEHTPPALALLSHSQLSSTGNTSPTHSPIACFRRIEHNTFSTSALATWLVVQIEILVRDAPIVVEVVLRRTRKNIDTD